MEVNSTKSILKFLITSKELDTIYLQCFYTRPKRHDSFSNIFKISFFLWIFLCKIIDFSSIASRLRRQVTQNKFPALLLYQTKRNQQKIISYFRSICLCKIKDLFSISSRLRRQVKPNVSSNVLLHPKEKHIFSICMHLKNCVNRLVTGFKIALWLCEVCFRKTSTFKYVQISAGREFCVLHDKNIK